MTRIFLKHKSSTKVSSPFISGLTLKTNKRAFQSALLTTELAMKTILSVENSERLRKLFADRFQSWIYQMYPREKVIISKMRN